MDKLWLCSPCKITAGRCCTLPVDSCCTKRHYRILLCTCTLLLLHDAAPDKATFAPGRSSRKVPGRTARLTLRLVGAHAWRRVWRCISSLTSDSTLLLYSSICSSSSFVFIVEVRKRAHLALDSSLFYPTYVRRRSTKAGFATTTLGIHRFRHPRLPPSKLSLLPHYNSPIRRCQLAN